MNQAKYTYDALSRAQISLRKVILPDKQLTKGLIVNVLQWLAETLNSSDAFFLSWPDRGWQIQIQESAITTTDILKANKTIRNLDILKEWLEEKEEVTPWVRNDTSDIKEFQSLNIKSVLVTKIIIGEEVGFKGRGLIMVCNRKGSISIENMYVSYDTAFCDIAKWVLRLYTSEFYSSTFRQYINAKERYEDAKNVSSLTLVGTTAHELLKLYGQYSAQPPPSLLYNYLDAHIALFNVNEIKQERLRIVLEDCRQWLGRVNDTDSELIRYALARGYFALGIETNEDWLIGKKLLSVEGEGVAND